MGNQFIKPALLSCLLILTGCGSSDNDEGNTQGNNNNGNNNGGNNGANANSDAFWKDKEAVVTASAMSVGLAVPMSILDELVLIGDYALDGKKCKSGTVTVSNDVINFNDCKGFAFDDDETISGQIMVSNERKLFTFKDFIFHYSADEEETFNGVIKLTDSGVTATYYTDKLVGISKEKANDGKIRTVQYTLTDYEYIWTDLTGTEISIKTQGKAEVKGSPQGDHNLSFSNVDAPFLFKNEGSHPYSGVLKIVDLNNSKNYAILSANSDAKTYRHEGYANGQLVSNFTNQWDVLDYN